ncbi:MAG TPA: hypothetical protein VFH47_04735 [Candidatus Thermoplasmatota archaeon]|nr:hypothetical protein [Candidatus Thermoplasmatota archaeon]
MPASSTLRLWIAWPFSGALAATVFAFVAMLAIGLSVGLVADVDAAMAGAGAFTVAITCMFAAAGVGLGIASWLAAGRVLPSGWWVAGWAAGLGLAGLLFGLAEWVVGDEATWSAGVRLGDEVVHNVAGGLLAGYLTWRYALRQLGVAAKDWVWVPAAGLLLAGLTVWGVTAAAGTDASNGMPLGFLVLAAVSAAGYARLPMRGRASVETRAAPA